MAAGAGAGLLATRGAAKALASGALPPTQEELARALLKAGIPASLAALPQQ
jgi:hypothetical protein